MMFRAGDPAAYVRQPWHLSRENMLLAQYVPVGLALLTIIAWPVGGMLRRIRKGKGDNRRNARLARYLALTVSLLVLGAITAIIAGTTEIKYRVSPVMMAGLGMRLLAAISATALVILTVLAWRNHYWSAIGRIYFTLLALPFVAFTWFLNEWNLLGFRF